MADGARSPMVFLTTVCLPHTRKAPPFNHTGEAASFRRACYINDISGGEDTHVDVGANLQAFCTINTHFPQKPMGCDICFLEMSTLGAIDLVFVSIGET